MEEEMVFMKSLTLMVDEALLQSVAILMLRHLMNVEAMNQLTEIAMVASLIVIVAQCHQWEVLHTTGDHPHPLSILKQELAWNMDVAGRHHLVRWEIPMADLIETFMKQSLLILTVPDAIPAVHQSTAETWEPAAINRNRLEEAMRSAERDRVVKPMRLSEKKENVSLIDRVYLVSTDRSTSCV